MRRQTFYESAAFYTSNGGAPFMLRKRVRQPRSESVRSIPPEIILVIPSVNLFLVIELLDGSGVFAIRQSHQNMGQAKAHILGVLALPKVFPCNVGIVIKDFRHVSRTS